MAIKLKKNSIKKNKQGEYLNYNTPSLPSDNQSGFDQLQDFNYGNMGDYNNVNVLTYGAEQAKSMHNLEQQPDFDIAHSNQFPIDNNQVQIGNTNELFMTAETNLYDPVQDNQQNYNFQSEFKQFEQPNINPQPQPSNQQVYNPTQQTEKPYQLEFNEPTSTFSRVKSEQIPVNNETIEYQNPFQSDNIGYTEEMAFEKGANNFGDPTEFVDDGTGRSDYEQIRSANPNIAMQSTPFMQQNDLGKVVVRPKQDEATYDSLMNGRYDNMLYDPETEPHPKSGTRQITQTFEVKRNIKVPTPEGIDKYRDQLNNVSQRHTTTVNYLPEEKPSDLIVSNRIDETKFEAPKKAPLPNFNHSTPLNYNGQVYKQPEQQKPEAKEQYTQYPQQYAQKQYKQQPQLGNQRPLRYEEMPQQNQEQLQYMNLRSQMPETNYNNTLEVNKMVSKPELYNDYKTYDPRRSVDPKIIGSYERDKKNKEILLNKYSVDGTYLSSPDSVEEYFNKIENLSPVSGDTRPGVITQTKTSSYKQQDIFDSNIENETTEYLRYETTQEYPVQQQPEPLEQSVQYQEPVYEEAPHLIEETQINEQQNIYQTNEQPIYDGSVIESTGNQPIYDNYQPGYNTGEFSVNEYDETPYEEQNISNTTELETQSFTQEIPQDTSENAFPSATMEFNSYAEPGAFRSINLSPDFQIPSSSLLPYVENKNVLSNEQINEKMTHLAGIINETFAMFKIGAEVEPGNFHYGPTVISFNISVGKGINVSRITKISDNLKLNLSARTIRIQAPIPGKPFVGIEIPNDTPEVVFYKNIFDIQHGSKSPNDKYSSIDVPLGKDIFGNVKEFSISKSPHMLVAGTTGSGKSVLINVLLTTMLMNYSPNELRLLLVDPKMVEFAPYANLPHLITPVIHEPKKAKVALDKLVDKMETRFKQMAEAGVRNIESWNELRKAQGLSIIPYVVVVIDELADLMMVSGKEVEVSIARITQKARAAGIHMIVATQRPSTDVITGLIKSNIPTRIAFAVSSGIDSRTILDSSGAETLLGKGDMLVSLQGMPAFRAQSPYISDSEISLITGFIKRQQLPEFDPDFDILEDQEVSVGGVDTNDPMFIEAVNIIQETGKASTSYLQRRLKIGYNRAADLIDALEIAGYVGPPNGSKPRDVY